MKHNTINKMRGFKICVWLYKTMRKMYRPHVVTLIMYQFLLGF
jgi:hypothetical protein